MKKLAIAMTLALAATLCAKAIDDSKWTKGPTEQWFVNWDKALAEAKKTNKPLFVLNTGSDWCHWCIRLRQDVFDQEAFKAFAKDNFILVYLDNPRFTAIPEDQKDHNRRIVRALSFGGGVPAVSIFSPDGRKFGSIGGGGIGVEPYLGRVKALLANTPEAVDGQNARSLFAEGYDRLALECEAIQAKLATTPRKDFKAEITGIALVESQFRSDYGSLEFLPPETPIDVPFGQRIIFKIEYEFPAGFNSRIWMKQNWPKGQEGNDYYLASNGSGLYYGKGVAYGFLNLLERGKTCTLKSAAVTIYPRPEIADFPHGWDVGSRPVEIKFLEK